MLRFLTWFQGWFVRNPPAAPMAAAPSPRPMLSDLEYENVLMALLEEAEQGKSWGNLQGLLMLRHLSAVQLAQWLKAHSSCWIEQSERHQELARRLLILGRVASGELATIASAIGTQLQVSSVPPLPPEDSASVTVAPGVEVTGADDKSVEGRGSMATGDCTA